MGPSFLDLSIQNFVFPERKLFLVLGGSGVWRGGGGPPENPRPPESEVVGPRPGPSGLWGVGSMEPRLVRVRPCGGGTPNPRPPAARARTGANVWAQRSLPSAHRWPLPSAEG